ncbi:MAG: bifunctional DNA primase/polymerase [Pseudomonadota bacterium]|nr:bifunctional DNA primase/polymerase [Pseudomonadota bacterium]
MSTRLSAADYVAAGFALVPIPIGHKNPIAAGWQIEQNAIRTIEQADRLGPPVRSLPSARSRRR